MTKQSNRSATEFWKTWNQLQHSPTHWPLAINLGKMLRSKSSDAVAEFHNQLAANLAPLNTNIMRECADILLAKRLTDDEFIGYCATFLLLDKHERGCLLEDVSNLDTIRMSYNDVIVGTALSNLARSVHHEKTGNYLPTIREIIGATTGPFLQENDDALIYSRLRCSENAANRMTHHKRRMAYMRRQIEAHGLAMSMPMQITNNKIEAFAEAFEDANRLQGEMKNAEAMAAVNLALSYHPTSLEAKQLRADLLRSKCEYNQAIADYNAAIDSDKHNLNAYQGRAMAFAALGDSISAGYDLLKLDYLIEAEVFLKQEYDPHYDVIHGFVNNHTKHLQVLKTKLQPLAFEFVGYCSNRDQAAHIVELIKQNDGYDAVINNCNIPGIDLFSVTTRVSLLIASASEFTTWLTNLYNTHKSCGYRTVQWHFVYNLAARDIEKLPLVRLPLAVRPAIADYQHKYVEAWLAIQTGDINQAYFFLLQAKALGAGKDDVCNRALNDPVMAPLWSSLRNMVNTTIAADVVLAA